MENKDYFKKVYRPMKDESLKRIEHIKDKAEELLILLEYLRSREMGLAIANLEQCVMWATKGIALHDEMMNSIESSYEK